MAINWGQGGNFSFGNLDAAQQSLYESKPDLAYQLLQNWYGQGNPNFATTTAGRYIASRQDSLDNDYLSKAAQQQADWANQKQSWDTQQQQGLGAYTKQVSDLQAQYDALDPSKVNWTPEVMTRFNALGTQLHQLKANPYQVQQWSNPDAGGQLTWTKYLEQNGGNLGQQFNMLTSTQRGANPGAMEIKRNLW